MTVPETHYVLSSFFEMSHTKLAILKQVQKFLHMQSIDQSTQNRQEVVPYLSFLTYYSYKPAIQGLVCAMGSVTVTLLAEKNKTFCCPQQQSQTLCDQIRFPMGILALNESGIAIH